jgi:hypothetical protein
MKSVLAVLILLLPSIVVAEWAPPAKPDPDAILQEARRDTRAGRFADALAKHVWYHNNALKYEPALAAVRLSFALSYWHQLASVYPPALIKLRIIRDEVAEKVRRKPAGSSPFDSFAAFQEFSSINRELQEDGKTKDLFVWLDANRPNVAKIVFGPAEPALIQSKEYLLCGKYLDPDHTLEQEIEIYRLHKQMSEPRKEFQEFRENHFSDSVATLVALLVLNGRKADADRISREALKVKDDAAFRQALLSAAKGQIPPPG